MLLLVIGEKMGGGGKGVFGRKRALPRSKKDLTQNKSEDHEKSDRSNWSNFIRVGLLLVVFLST